MLVVDCSICVQDEAHGQEYSVNRFIGGIKDIQSLGIQGASKQLNLNKALIGVWPSAGLVCMADIDKAKWGKGWRTERLCLCGHRIFGRPSSFHSIYADDNPLIRLIVNDEGSDTKDEISELTDDCITRDSSLFSLKQTRGLYCEDTGQ